MLAPQRNVIYGLTHREDGSEVIRLPRSTKVSIGIPAGKEMHAFATPKGAIGVAVAKAISYFDTTEQSQAFWEEQFPNAPELKYPKRLDYFTFRKLGPDGILAPDFNAIQKHGYKPTNIGIRFVEEGPLQNNLEWYGAGRRKCWGDGINGLRLVEFPTPGHKDHPALIQDAKEHGEKWFPIVDGCRMRGCPFGNKTTLNGKTRAPECKNHGRLGFLLELSPGIGSQAEFNTTGYQSVSNLFSGLTVISGIARANGASIVGIPLRLILAPYTVIVEGNATEQFCVRLDFPIDKLEGLGGRLIAAAADFHSRGPAKVLPAAGAAAAIADTAVADLPEIAEDEVAALEAEFHPVDDEPINGDDDEAPEETPSSSLARETTATATETLAGKLKAARSRKTIPPTVAAQTPVVASPSSPPPEEPPPAVETPSPAPRARKDLF